MIRHDFIAGSEAFVGSANALKEEEYHILDIFKIQTLSVEDLLFPFVNHVYLQIRLI